jgi:hypothetical protein
MSRHAPSLTPSNDPPRYEDENPPSHHFFSHPEQRDPKIISDSTRHDSTASTGTGPSSGRAPHGLIAKLKEKKEALKQNLDEGIARGHSEEGAMLANRWNSEHIYASLGVPVASIKKWQEHEDKKQAKKEFDEIYKDIDWNEAGNGKRDLKDS